MGPLWGEALRTAPGAQEVLRAALPSDTWLLASLPHTPFIDPGPAVFQRPQALLLRQPCSPASVTAAFPRQSLGRPSKAPRVTRTVPRGTGEPLRRMHVAEDIAPQGQGGGAPGYPCCLWLLGSWHLSWQAKPLLHEPRGAGNRKGQSAWPQG